MAAGLITCCGRWLLTVSWSGRAMAKLCRVMLITLESWSGEDMRQHAHATCPSHRRNSVSALILAKQV